MQRAEEYYNERLDHLGIVAGVYQEIGLAGRLDALAPGQQRAVSYGKATVAMILNGLGFSNRQLYLVPQFLRTNQLLTCWVQGSQRICSMTIVWAARLTGSTSTM